ncbi:MAG TPA: MFS transporter [Acidimicrobiales bacterium]|jgi:MFS family permease|nr:MFS transporter [Acidimicrobiales bacterium]
MSPGATSTAPAGQPSVRSPLGRFLFDHTIEVYPTGRRRAGYLGLAVLATVVLYYVYYTQTGVTPNILAGFHMSFAFYIGIIVVSNLLGAFASLPASQTDRLGRTNVVIYGLLIVGLLTAVGIPLSNSQWSYAVLTCLIGIVEGAILVATPALVRDFSPQLGRASAMGFWTIGPVAGSLVTSLVALHTLDHFGETHWKSQFVISGVAALAVFLVSLLALKDLSTGLRDQLMVSARDQALIEARARGLSDHQLLSAREHPWRQILRWDLIGSSFGIATFLLVYYAAASLFTIYYPVIFKNADGTNFTVTQANGLNTWFWGADIVALIVVGLLSDALKVRKPFMLAGAVISMVMLVIFLGDATHAHTGYYTLALEASLLALGLSLVFAPWMAAYTESVEDKNPALVATGLALWGWVLRATVGLSFVFLPLIITSVNPIVDNLPVADTVIHGQSIQNFVAEHPKTIAFAQAHQSLLTLLAKDPAAAAAVAKNPDLANISAAIKAFGSKGLQELAPYKTQLQTLVQPYQDQLAFIQSHQAALQDLQKGSGEAPHQWQHWFYVDLAGMVIFIPLIWLTKGRWSPASARRDAVEHEARVREELARLIGEEHIPA